MSVLPITRPTTKNNSNIDSVVTAILRSGSARSNKLVSTRMRVYDVAKYLSRTWLGRATATLSSATTTAKTVLLTDNGGHRFVLLRSLYWFLWVHQTQNGHLMDTHYLQCFGDFDLAARKTGMIGSGLFHLPSAQPNAFSGSDMSYFCAFREL